MLPKEGDADRTYGGFLANKLKAVESIEGARYPAGGQRQYAPGFPIVSPGAKSSRMPFHSAYTPGCVTRVDNTTGDENQSSIPMLHNKLCLDHREFRKTSECTRASPLDACRNLVPLMA